MADPVTLGTVGGLNDGTILTAAGQPWVRELYLRRDADAVSRYSRLVVEGDLSHITNVDDFLLL